MGKKVHQGVEGGCSFLLCGKLLISGLILLELLKLLESLDY